MNPIAVLFSVALLVCTALAQLPPTYLRSGFHGVFPDFAGFGSPQILTSPFSPSGGSGGRPNTGTTVQGPILFPPAPESTDTSGVVVGASGYGFVPPGVNEIIKGQGFQSSSAFRSSLRQPFASYFHL